MNVPESPRDSAPPAERRPDQAAETAGRRRSLASERELAKLGLVVSMGVLVATGLSRTPSSKRWHILAGAAFIGLSAWHHLLYSPAKNSGGPGRGKPAGS